MDTTLSGPHQKIYRQLFQDPLSHNLHWRDIWSMVSAVADAEAVESEATLKVTRHGHTLILHRPKAKDMSETKELLEVRHFLDRSRAAAPAEAAVGTHLLVIIDHREARIFRAEVHDSIPQRITPYDPFGYGRDLHYNQNELSGQRKPERKSFYDDVARTLASAEQIVLFGTGTGTASAVDHLLGELRQYHATIASRVVATKAVDEHHLTEDQMLAMARELFIPR